jgi:hypothetical protein
MKQQMPALVIVVVIIAAFLFVPFLRRLLGLAIRLAIFAVAVAIAAAGVSMILNNETIFERPGFGQRVIRFVTMNSAASSTTGSGSVTCDMSAPAAAPSPATKPAHKHPARTEEETEKLSRTRNQPGTGPAPTEDVYPELIVRSFPGIPRDTLFKLSQDTVDSLGGWKIVKADPATGTLDCIYTSRYLKLEDDVRITVESSGQIDVCSRSGMARPDQTSLLRYFPGDLGANVGHIKEFYETLEPKMDEVYKEQQEKENAKKPH